MNQQTQHMPMEDFDHWCSYHSRTLNKDDIAELRSIVVRFNKEPIVPKGSEKAHYYCDECGTNWREKLIRCPQCGMIGMIGRTGIKNVDNATEDIPDHL